MGAGEAVVWVVGMICATIVVCVIILAIAIQFSEKKDD